MKILFLVPYVPSLIRVRPYNLIRSLANRGNRITLVTLWSNLDERETLTELEKYCEKIFAFPLSRWRSLYNCVLALPTSTPLQSVYCWQPELAKTVSQMVWETAPGEEFDVIHIEHLRGAKYGVELNLDGQKTLRPVNHQFRQSFGIASIILAIYFGKHRKQANPVLGVG